MTDYIENASSDRSRRMDVPQEFAGLRLDQALARLLPEYSRSRLQEWMRSGHIKVNGATAAPKDRVWGGETVLVTPQALPGETRHLPEDIPLEVVFEDRDLLVINKPVGLVVHPGSGNWSGTLLNALLRHAPELEAVPRAGIVHRLDKDTSGLLVIARNLIAQTDLVRQLQARTVSREYLAIVRGLIGNDGVIEAPIGRHPVNRKKMAVVARGKPARTYYEVVERGRNWSALRCRLDTGRTHQIRVHLHSIGLPLIGDPTYGPVKRRELLPEFAERFPRQALHAGRLALVHPQTGEKLSWEAPVPGDINALLEVLRRG